MDEVGNNYISQNSTNKSRDRWSKGSSFEMNEIPKCFSSNIKDSMKPTTLMCISDVTQEKIHHGSISESLPFNTFFSRIADSDSCNSASGSKVNGVGECGKAMLKLNYNESSYDNDVGMLSSCCIGESMQDIRNINDLIVGGCIRIDVPDKLSRKRTDYNFSCGEAMANEDEISNEDCLDDDNEAKNYSNGIRKEAGEFLDGYIDNLVETNLSDVTNQNDLMISKDRGLSCVVTRSEDSSICANTGLSNLSAIQFKKMTQDNLCSLRYHLGILMAIDDNVTNENLERARRGNDLSLVQSKKNVKFGELKRSGRSKMSLELNVGVSGSFWQNSSSHCNLLRCHDLSYKLIKVLKNESGSAIGGHADERKPKSSDDGSRNRPNCSMSEHLEGRYAADLPTSPLRKGGLINNFEMISSKNKPENEGTDLFEECKRKALAKDSASTFELSPHNKLENLKEYAGNFEIHDKKGCCKDVEDNSCSAFDILKKYGNHISYDEPFNDHNNASNEAHEVSKLIMEDLMSSTYSRVTQMYMTSEIFLADKDIYSNASEIHLIDVERDGAIDKDPDSFPLDAGMYEHLKVFIGDNYYASPRTNRDGENNILCKQNELLLFANVNLDIEEESEKNVFFQSNVEKIVDLYENQKFESNIVHKIESLTSVLNENAIDNSYSAETDVSKANPVTLMNSFLFNNFISKNFKDEDFPQSFASSGLPKPASISEGHKHPQAGVILSNKEVFPNTVQAFHPISQNGGAANGELILLSKTSCVKLNVNSVLSLEGDDGSWLNKTFLNEMCLPEASTKFVLNKDCFTANEDDGCLDETETNSGYSTDLETDLTDTLDSNHGMIMPDSDNKSSTDESRGEEIDILLNKRSKLDINGIQRDCEVEDMLDRSANQNRKDLVEKSRISLENDFNERMHERKRLKRGYHNFSVVPDLSNCGDGDNLQTMFAEKKTKAPLCDCNNYTKSTLNFESGERHLHKAPSVSDFEEFNQEILEKFKEFIDKESRLSLHAPVKLELCKRPLRLGLSKRYKGSRLHN